MLLWGLAAGSVAGAMPAEWQLVWADEFENSGAPDPTKWTHELGAGGWGNREVQTYTSDLANSRVEDGRLIIEVHQNRESRVPSYTSARLITREKGQWKYGRMEIRAKLPSETGTWPAIWMLAADTLHSEDFWPDNGEIDIMEAVGYEEDPLFKEIVGNPQLPNIHGSLHTAARHGGNSISGKTYIEDASSAFHTYAVNWYEDRIEFEVDGVTYNTIYRSTVIPARNPPENPWEYWPFTQRFFLVMNIAVGGEWGGHFNSTYYPEASPYGPDGIDHEGVWPQRMEVEYVRVYSEPPVAAPTTVPGPVMATAMDASAGIVLEKSRNESAPHNLHRIDAGDWAEFLIEAPAAGTYTLQASVAATDPGGQFTLRVPETASAREDIMVPDTAGGQSWETVNLGELTLQQGHNTLRLETGTGGFKLAWFSVAAASGSTWKGYPVDALGNVDTESWLGWINVNTAPWIYSYSLDKYIFSLAALGDTFHTGSQWIYLPR